MITTCMRKRVAYMRRRRMENDETSDAGARHNQPHDIPIHSTQQDEKEEGERFNGEYEEENQLIDTFMYLI